MKKLCKYLTLFSFGGTIYIIIEILWRSIRGNLPTHWAMFIVGGLAFLLVGAVNEYLNWSTPIWLQCFIGTISILVLEFISGCILNLWLDWDIWDYSNTPLNIYGQVCLPFAIAWYFLSALGIIADDYLRYWLFHEEKPHYCWCFKKCGD